MSDKDNKANILVNQGLEAALKGIENAEEAKQRKAGIKDLELFFGFDEKESFANLSYEEQESVINSYVEKSKSGDFLGSAEQLMEGLHYKPPAPTPATPTPAFSAPTPGGMGAGGNVVRMKRPPVQNNDGNNSEDKNPEDSE